MQAEASQAQHRGNKQKSKAQHKQDSEIKQKVASLSAAEQAQWLQHEFVTTGKATILEAEALSGAAPCVHASVQHHAEYGSITAQRVSVLQLHPGLTAQ